MFVQHAGTTISANLYASKIKFCPMVLIHATSICVNLNAPENKLCTVGTEGKLTYIVVTLLIFAKELTLIVINSGASKRKLVAPDS